MLVIADKIDRGAVLHTPLPLGASPGSRRPACGLALEAVRKATGSVAKGRPPPPDLEAETRVDAEAAFDTFPQKYEAKYPRAADCLVNDRTDQLAFYRSRASMRR